MDILSCNKIHINMRIVMVNWGKTSVRSKRNNQMVNCSFRYESFWFWRKKWICQSKPLQIHLDKNMLKAMSCHSNWCIHFSLILCIYGCVVIGNIRVVFFFSCKNCNFYLVSVDDLVIHLATPTWFNSHGYIRTKEVFHFSQGTGHN